MSRITQQRNNQRVLWDNYYLTWKGLQLTERATEQFPEAWYTRTCASRAGVG